jgi:hypothetical protein
MDTGLFCIHASATPSHVKEMAEVIIHEMVAMSGKLSISEITVSIVLKTKNACINKEFLCKINEIT